MFSIPLGEVFESIVNWLINSFQGFFDGISAVLNFSITILERTLLLDEKVLYAPILFGLLFAYVVGTFAKRKLGKRAFIPVVLVTILVFAGLEFWRVKSLNQVLDPETARAYADDYQALADSFEKAAPEDFSGAEKAVKAVSNGIEADESSSNTLSKLNRMMLRSERNLSRIRSDDFERVYSTLERARKEIDESGLSVKTEALDRLDKELLRYQSLSLIEEAERLVSDFKKEAGVEDPDRMNEFLNQRTYDTVQELLAASETYFSEVVESPDEERLGLITTAQKDLNTFNPDRLAWYPPIVSIILLALIAYLIAGSGMVIFSVLGFMIIIGIDLWIPTIESLALVLSATLFALIIGIPVGISAARSETVNSITRPILDFMQTMPAFVYLIPAVIFFGLGKVPGAMATLIFSMPPAVRLTSLGIRQVPSEVVEAAQSFGATPRQLLLKAQLPIAMITILAGVNQTIMLALSMVVIGGMIGAGGLGEVVLSGITQLKLGLGFEGGIAVVILAIYLDRVTQALGKPKNGN